MQIYNSMTRKKEEFKPIHEGKVGIYACGPTVYNFFHIGNARPFIVFDVLRRYLEYRGYEVTFVQNFTDIDDKMIKKANEEGVTVKDIADRYIAEYYTDWRTSVTLLGNLGNGWYHVHDGTSAGYLRQTDCEGFVRQEDLTSAEDGHG